MLKFEKCDGWHLSRTQTHASPFLCYRDWQMQFVMITWVCISTVRLGTTCATRTTCSPLPNKNHHILGLISLLSCIFYPASAQYIWERYVQSARCRTTLYLVKTNRSGVQWQTTFAELLRRIFYIWLNRYQNQSPSHRPLIASSITARPRPYWEEARLRRS